MANQQHQEFEDAITCPVCLSRYDEVEKKPKYLVSCCHTVCRFCLERISRCGTLNRVLCPICRCPTNCSAGIDSLPTNGDKLYLLKLEEPLQKSDDEALNWCFTCRKRTSQSCSFEKHSLIVMNPQLLNSDIHLNMASISARVRACGELVLQNRLSIGAKLDHVSLWLSVHQQMIDRLKAANSSRISQLRDMIEGSDITISIQKLMQLSITKEGDLGLLSGTLEEKALTKKLLEEFEAVEKTAEISTMGRFNTLLDLPSVPHLQKELNFIHFFGNTNRVSQWPIVLLESLVTKNESVPIPTTNPFLLDVERSPLFGSLQRETRCITLLQNASATINVSSASPNSRSETTAPTVFRFGINNSAPASLSTSPTDGTRDFRLARRRRPFLQFN